MPFITYSFRRDEHGEPTRVESGIHLGLAVDSERKDGTRFLIVPVIRNAGDSISRRSERPTKIW